MDTLLSCFPQLFKVQERKLNGTKVVCGSNVPQVRKFHGIKVLGTFPPEEQKFQGCESYMERKFSDFLRKDYRIGTPTKFSVWIGYLAY